MYIVVNNENNLVVDNSEDIAYDVFNNILTHNKQFGFFGGQNSVYEVSTLPEGFDNYQWTYDGVEFTKIREEETDLE